MTLPASVLALVELSPIEDIALAILREGLPEIPVYSLIPENQPDVFILVRRAYGLGNWSADSRFTDEARIHVQCYAVDPNGDQDAALLSEAVRVVLRNAWLNHVVVPGRGSIIEIKMTSEPARRSDYVTATGPVQYADLPTGKHRYETTYSVSIRKPR